MPRLSTLFQNHSSDSIFKVFSLDLYIFLTHKHARTILSELGIWGVTENPICFIFCFPGQLSTLQIHDQICNEILDINSLIDLGRFYFSLLKKCEMAGPLSTFFFSFDHKILPHGDKSTGSQAVSFCSTDKVTTQSDIIVQLNHPLMKGLRYWIHKRYFCSEKCERPRAMTILWLFSEVS